ADVCSSGARPGADLEREQPGLVVGELRPERLLVPRLDLDVAVALRPLRAQPEPDADVVGQVDLLTRGPRGEVEALGLLDAEGDRCAGHDGSSGSLYDDGTRTVDAGPAVTASPVTSEIALAPLARGADADDVPCQV